MSTAGHRRPGVVRLVAGVVAAVAVWCGLLPRLLRFGPVARHVARMEERGVDPAAMYYTELERLPLRPAWVDDAIILWPGPGASIGGAPRGGPACPGGLCPRRRGG